MKTVTTHAGIVQLGRNRETLCDVGIGGVERGIEARYLRQVRPALEQGADRRQVVRLMQRRERNEFLERGEDICVEPHRLRVFQPAVHDAVADRREFGPRPPRIKSAR